MLYVVAAVVIAVAAVLYFKPDLLTGAKAKVSAAASKVTGLFK